jgi:CheY-like chemotaxis protein
VDNVIRSGDEAIRMAGFIILVVEDEPLILMDIASALEDGGYAVVAVASADLAIRYLEDHEPAPAGLLTDIKLAGEILSGWDIAQRARALAPAISVIYMSGDSGADWEEQGVPESVFLQKPFTSAQMFSAISSALDSRIQSGSP